MNARAQRAQAWRDSSDVLLAAVRALRDSVLSGDSSVSEVARAGNLVIAASTAQRGQAAAHLDALSRVRSRWFGAALPSRDGFRIVMRVGTGTGGGLRWSQREQRAGTLVVAGLPDTGASHRLEQSVEDGAVDDALVNRFAGLMIASVPTLSKWIVNPPPASMPDNERRQLAMYSFATGTGAMQQRCVAGDVLACRYALDIEHAPPTETGAAFPEFSHADFLYYTLDRGGAGAWERLRDSSVEHLGDGLAAAAKMPLDSLIAHWRLDLLNLRPASATVSLPSALFTIGWIALLVLGTLGVSKWS